MKVQLSVPGCPAQGFVYSSYIRPSDIEALNITTKVGVDGLAYRSEPRASDETLDCRLNTTDTVRILDEEVQGGSVTWVKVAVEPAKEGCSPIGYMAKHYLNPPSFFAGLATVAKTVDCPICDQLRVQNQEAIFGWMSVLQRQLASDEPNQNRDPADVAGLVARLALEAERSANRYRQYAPHVCRRMGRRHPCGGTDSPNKSKGWCKSGVREALERALGLSLPGAAASSPVVRTYLGQHMTRLAVDSCEAAPRGSVCVYTGGSEGFGHIEIKADTNKYCSDYCAARPIRTRTFVGAYYP